MDEKLDETLMQWDPHHVIFHDIELERVCRYDELFSNARCFVSLGMLSLDYQPVGQRGHFLNKCVVDLLSSVLPKIHRQRSREMQSATLSFPRPTVFSTTPAPQSCTSAFVKDLVYFEGVPSQIRHCVWAYLANSAARQVDISYAELRKQKIVADLSALKEDAAKFVVKHPEVRAEALINILRTYLATESDVHYEQGLVSIAGFVLLQSPHDEEAAFWTFTSIMHSRMRPYFCKDAGQLTRDSETLKRDLESSCPTLAKKLFDDLQVPHLTLCHAWFKSMFVDIIPLKHAQYLWDRLLCDETRTLAHIAQSILARDQMKIALLDSDSHLKAMEILVNPPDSFFPNDPSWIMIRSPLSISVRMDDMCLIAVKHLVLGWLAKLQVFHLT
ncbi:rab-GTPase-TBC domain-containing protein [Cristinia sonorae]|uniref:Rab-GTPase-TBC domain-containing protein n=1 Tax=Cristinia sonorae TaxID=1940300 RepID=A0A8K0UP66_9AGAR|nr:rab-GTPase-TBC domain-containing protein [Cristinia sonorae]